MRKRIRRFNPQCGVSRPLLEAEAKVVAREMENYLRLSLTDLRQKLSERGSAWDRADKALCAAVLDLPERERLAVQCLIVRDLHHILELFLEWKRSHAAQSEAPRPLAPPTALEPRLPFNEWLFVR